MEEPIRFVKRNNDCFIFIKLEMSYINMQLYSMKRLLDFVVTEYGYSKTHYIGVVRN